MPSKDYFNPKYIPPEKFEQFIQEYMQENNCTRQLAEIAAAKSLITERRN
jgi:hypothetical protein